MLPCFSECSLVEEVWCAALLTVLEPPSDALVWCWLPPSWLVRPPPSALSAATLPAPVVLRHLSSLTALLMKGCWKAASGVNRWSVFHSQHFYQNL